LSGRQSADSGFLSTQPIVETSKSFLFPTFDPGGNGLSSYIKDIGYLTDAVTVMAENEGKAAHTHSARGMVFVNLPKNDQFGF
jgi:hypothetical protein